MAYTIEAINGKNMKKMAKKHAQLALFNRFFVCGALFKSNNQLAYLKNRELDVECVDKRKKMCLFTYFHLFVPRKKKDNTAQHLRNTL